MKDISLSEKNKGFIGGSEERICLTMQETQETWFRSLGREDPWRRKWQPTPVFLPGKSHGQRSLVGYSLWIKTNCSSPHTVWIWKHTYREEKSVRIHYWADNRGYLPHLGGWGVKGDFVVINSTEFLQRWCILVLLLLLKINTHGNGSWGWRGESHMQLSMVLSGPQAPVHSCSSWLGPLGLQASLPAVLTGSWRHN